MVDITYLEIVNSVQKIIEFISKYEENLIDNSINSSQTHYDKLVEYKDIILPEIATFVAENPQLFENYYFSEQISKRLKAVYDQLFNYQVAADFRGRINDYLIRLSHIDEIKNDLFDAQRNWETTSAIIRSELQPKLEDVNRQIEGIERAKLAIENDKITTAYKSIYLDFSREADKFEEGFFCSVGAGVVFALLSMAYFNDSTDINYWFSKFLIITLTITFSTYFLRRSINLRKISEQLKKEAWEMDALPVFIASLDKTVRDEVIKELVPKYFGKEIDQSINNKMADLVNEQIKTSLEVFKTSMDIVKSMKSSISSSESDEAKEKPKTE